MYLSWGGTSFADGVQSGDQVTFIGPGASTYEITATSVFNFQSNVTFLGVQDATSLFPGSPFHFGYQSTSSDESLVFGRNGNPWQITFDFDAVVSQGLLATKPRLALIDVEATDTLGGGEVQTFTTNGTPWIIQEVIGSGASGWTGENTNVFEIDLSIEETPLILTSDATQFGVDIRGTAGGRSGFGIGYFLGCDRSDAAASFGEARHLARTDILLGNVIDSEDNSIASPTATNDNTDDGVTIPQLRPDRSNTITATVSGSGGRLQAWIDWNGNLEFDAGEQIASDLQDNGPDDLDPAIGSIDFDVSLPTGTLSGQYTARFRWSTIAGLAPIGDAPDGEVEDYLASVLIPQSDLAITKTNTPGINGNVDQSTDTLVSGANTTYTIIVSNNGPDSVIGAIVTDNPVSGLTCPPDNPVTISGNGVPIGSYTNADLTGPGIVLGELANGEAATLEFSCEVD